MLSSADYNISWCSSMCNMSKKDYQSLENPAHDDHELASDDEEEEEEMDENVGKVFCR